MIGAEQRGVRGGGGSSTAGDVARSYLASFASGDPEAVAAHVAPDFVNDHASALGTGSVGRDEYRRRLPGFLASFPGLRYEVVSVIEAAAPAAEPSGDDPGGDDRADGRAVAVEYRMTGTSGGHPIDLRGVMVMTVGAGLITRRTDYWDALAYLRQVDRAP